MQIGLICLCRLRLPWCLQRKAEPRQTRVAMQDALPSYRRRTVPMPSKLSLKQISAYCSSAR
jgi:hypothetical protein